MSDSPRAYFADLAAYNNGRLRGVWVEFTEEVEPDDVRYAIDYMLRGSTGDEWRIDDTEGFAGFESWDIEALCTIAALIREHGEDAVKGFIGHVGSDAAEQADQFTDIYLGCYESEQDFCERTMGEEIDPEAEKIRVFDWGTLAQYIDWESIAHDAFINAYWSHETGHNECHVYLRT